MRFLGDLWTGLRGRAKSDDSAQMRPGRPLFYSNGRINALVCMFNSFALARPFCESMKIPAEGEIGSRAAAGSDIGADAVVCVWAERGDF